MEEQLLEVLPNIERRSAVPATFANVQRLLGLLGTVIGLIGVHRLLSADPAEKGRCCRRAFRYR
jgi:biopolymer transport protein ExbB/TolQ